MPADATIKIKGRANPVNNAYIKFNTLSGNSSIMVLTFNVWHSIEDCQAGELPADIITEQIILKDIVDTVTGDITQAVDPAVATILPNLKTVINDILIASAFLTNAVEA